MSLGAITEVAPLDHQHPFPGDLRLQRPDVNGLHGIPAAIRWEGMRVYVVALQTDYELVGGILDANWVAGVRLGSFSAVSPLAYNAATGAFSLPQATATVPGYLASGDWTTFNAKQNALGGSGMVRSTAGTISYVSGSAAQFIKGDGSLDSSVYLTANQAITLTATGDVTGTSTSSGTAPAITLSIASAIVTGKLLTGLNIAGSNVTAADSILSAIGKLQNMITGLAGSIIYQGVWNASTNTSPTLTSGTGTKGWLYKVSVAGSTNLDGTTQWNVGDQVVFDGTTWDKIDGVASEVLNFNGRVGPISLLPADISTALGYSAYNGSTNTLGFLTGTTGIQNSTSLQPSSNFNISGTGVASGFTIGATTAAGNNFLVSGSGSYTGYSAAFGNGYTSGGVQLGISVNVGNMTTVNSSPLFQFTTAIQTTTADVAGQDLYQFNGYIIGTPTTAITKRMLVNVRNNNSSMFSVNPVGDATHAGSLVMSNANNGGIYWNVTPAYNAVATGYSFGMEQNLTSGVWAAFMSSASTSAGSAIGRSYLYSFAANGSLTYTSNVPLISVGGNMAVSGYFTGALKTTGSLQAGVTTSGVGGSVANHVLSSVNVSGSGASKYQILNVGLTNQISLFAEGIGSCMIGYNIDIASGAANFVTHEAGFSLIQEYAKSTGLYTLSPYANSAAGALLGTTRVPVFTVDATGNGTFAGSIRAGTASPGSANHILSSANLTGNAASLYQILNIGTANQISFFAEGNGYSDIGFNVNTLSSNSGRVTNEAGYSQLIRADKAGGSLIFYSTQATAAAGAAASFYASLILDKVGNATFLGAVASKGTIKNITVVSANYTVLPVDEVIQCQGTTGAFTITLPTATNVPTGRIITVIRDPNSTGAAISISAATASAVQTPGGGYVGTVTLGMGGAAGSRLSYINNGGGGWALLSSF